MELSYFVAPKRHDHSWLGKREVCHTASAAASTAINLADDEKNVYVAVLCRRWELTRVFKGAAFTDVLEAIGGAMAQLPADGQKAPRGKRKLEVYEMLKKTFQDDRLIGYIETDLAAVATDLLVQLRPYLK